MRWENLFGDLESQLEFELEADDRAQRIEEERLRVARLTVRDRLVFIARDTIVSMGIGPEETFHGVLRGVGKDWFCLETSDPDRDALHAGIGGRTLLVPLRSMQWCDALTVRAEISRGEQSRVARSLEIVERVSLAFVLRDLARRRVPVGIRTTSMVCGTVQRVGADHCDVAVHPNGTPPRRSNVRAIRTVPFHVIHYVEL